MLIANEAFIETVDEPTYQYGRSLAVPLAKVAIAADYIVRLKEEPPFPKAYAADYCVTVDEIVMPKKRRFISWFKQQHKVVALLPVDAADGSVPLDAKPVKYHIKEDGLLYAPGISVESLTTGVTVYPETEIGYLLEDSGEAEDPYQETRIALQEPSAV